MTDHGAEQWAGDDLPVEERPFRPDPADTDREERAELDRLLDLGLLRRLPGAVVVSAAAPDTPALRAMALVLALSPPGCGQPTGPTAHAVVGHASAAWLHAGGPLPDGLDLVIPPGSARPRRTGLRVHEHRLQPWEIQVVAGLQVTTASRTAADIARSLPPARVGPALERLTAGCGVTAVDVLDQLERMRYGRGVVRARELVQAWAAVVAARAQLGGV